MTFWIENKIGFYTLEPVIDSFIIKNEKVRLICHESVTHFVKEKYSANINVNFIQFHTSRYYSILTTLHYVLMVCLTPHSFSKQYFGLIHPVNKKNRLFYRFLYALSFITPKVSKHKVNKVLNAVFSLLPTYDFSTKLLIVASRVTSPVLLCQSRLKTITVMESWDHPVKTPAGYVSYMVFCWNESLKKDWIHYQGDEKVYSFFSLKLRYWLALEQNRKDVTADLSRNVILYAAGTSSHTKDSLFKKELEVLELICEAIDTSSYTLLVKPKPNGVGGDFDYLTKKYKNVKIGIYSNAKTSTAYYLSDDINKNRGNELEECTAVINTFTTFCIDAALYSKPVIQLNLLHSSEFPEITTAQQNHHIKEYLLNEEDLCLNVNNRMELKDKLAHLLKKNDFDTAISFSNKLKKWISNNDIEKELAFLYEKLKSIES